MSKKLSSYQKLKLENEKLRKDLREVKMAIYNDAGSKLSQIKMEMHLKVGMSDAMWFGERDEFPPKQYDGIRSMMKASKPNVVPLTEDRINEIVDEMNNETPPPRILLPNESKFMDRMVKLHNEQQIKDIEKLNKDEQRLMYEEYEEPKDGGFVEYVTLEELYDKYNDCLSEPDIARFDMLLAAKAKVAPFVNNTKEDV